MKVLYILILLSILIIPATATTNWTYNNGNESQSVVVDFINGTGMQWAYTIAMENKSNATDFPVVPFAMGMSNVWYNLFESNGGLFIIILWGILTIMAYRVSGTVVVPCILGIITGSAIMLLVPEFDKTWMIVMVTASIAVIIYTTFVGED